MTPFTPTEIRLIIEEEYRKHFDIIPGGWLDDAAQLGKGRGREVSKCEFCLKPAKCLYCIICSDVPKFICRIFRHRKVLLCKKCFGFQFTQRSPDGD